LNRFITTVVFGGFLLSTGAVANAQAETKLDSPVGTMQSDRVFSKCLDIVAGGGLRSDVRLKKCNGAATQQWFEETIGPNYYKIISNANKNVCLGVLAADRTQLVAAPCANVKNQFFNFNAVKKTYRAAITSDLIGPAMCLGVKESAKLDRPIMNKCGGFADQSWKLPG